eukprot:363408-Chlamydomonas_euryale.AAC.5
MDFTKPLSEHGLAELSPVLCCAFSRLPGTCAHTTSTPHMLHSCLDPCPTDALLVSYWRLDPCLTCALLAP